MLVSKRLLLNLILDRNCPILSGRCIGGMFKLSFYAYFFSQGSVLDGHGVCASLSSRMLHRVTSFLSSNKWVLSTTTVPLFFLFSQLFIAVILFLCAHFLGFLQMPLHWDPVVVKGLMPTATLNVIGLRYYPYSLHHLMLVFMTMDSASATIPSNTSMRPSTKSPAGWCSPSQSSHPASSCTPAHHCVFLSPAR